MLWKRLVMRQSQWFGLIITSALAAVVLPEPAQVSAQEPGFPCGCCYQEFMPWPNYWHQQFAIFEWTDYCAGGGQLRLNEPEGTHSDLRVGSCVNGTKHRDCDGMLIAFEAAIESFAETGDGSRIVALMNAHGDLVHFTPARDAINLLHCSGSGLTVAQFNAPMGWSVRGSVGQP